MEETHQDVVTINFISRSYSEDQAAWPMKPCRDQSILRTDMTHQHPASVRTTQLLEFVAVKRHGRVPVDFQVLEFTAETVAALSRFHRPFGGTF